jgi:hypothetical protein
MHGPKMSAQFGGSVVSTFWDEQTESDCRILDGVQFRFREETVWE